jgi:hypothetical protein
MSISDHRLDELSIPELEDFIAETESSVISMEQQLQDYHNCRFCPKDPDWVRKVLTAKRYKVSEIGAAKRVLKRKTKELVGEQHFQSVKLAVDANLVRAKLHAEVSEMHNARFIEVLKEFIPKETFLAAVKEFKRREGV